jgi:putative oxidoreductase
MSMRTVLTWVLSGILALAFLGAALAKLTGQHMMVAEFESFGYPIAFMYLTGIIELIGAGLVLVPRYAYAGAMLLSAVMVGALFSHLTHGQAGMIGPPLVLLVLALVVGTLRNWGRLPALSTRNA